MKTVKTIMLILFLLNSYTFAQKIKLPQMNNIVKQPQRVNNIIKIPVNNNTKTKLHANSNSIFGTTNTNPNNKKKQEPTKDAVKNDGDAKKRNKKSKEK